MKKKMLWLPMLLSIASMPALADNNLIEAQLAKMQIKAESIQPTPIVGLNAVLSEKGIFYITDDGKYLTAGPIYNINGDEPVSIANKVIMKKIDSLKNEMIVYKAPNERHVITVFTDISCPYCQKFHKEVPELNKNGITVRYLAFPRNGITNNVVSKEMNAVWCSGFPNKSLDSAFKGDNIIAIDECKKININEHFKVGTMMGIKGTPAIVLPNATIYGGYISANNLVELLDKKEK
ncbi:bifunctional protein-disulfide isomerase/oxidoreductase DsbC [Proteus myxofaciens]|uniref:Thiol:disulfide interchange protein n=1 Tax=Proteus myxofaciens ATCC 19692 TaxID=1354337 RepID=A0A198GCZ8_9GAMM|nr:bifunctional protein-disulfide isomerase/oxidoreductase DsbC [Proteus myxofaciens]OAT34968.1 thiol:disulfide interchange protein [Proteus myxofaciens ATCC 19692]